MRHFSKLFKIVAAFALVGLICCIPAYIVVFKILPTQDPDNQFNRSTILQVLSGETRVYYNDGEELLGAFFDANHRVYVPYGDIPANIVNALIAAEDAGYWTHSGFSIYGFTRAMISNIKSGHMRQGGSTLTQQTVKNIFGREERSIKEKGKELINALRMEKHFSKEDILEFYLNQFHVSGTGKGVAIAAQYFFNKELKDLTLAECAFIAGSVKGPFNYDPFIQRNAERREKALARGKERLEYVLGRMVEENYISEEEMNEALAKPLEFNHGNFRFSVSTMLDRIEEKLDGEFFQKKFEAEGIEDWRKAQLSITTTVDARSQDAAKTALQANISGLQMQLGGFVLPKAQFANRAQTARKGDYLYGTVDSIMVDDQGGLKALTLNFGQLKGLVSEAAVKDFAKKAGGDVNKILAPQLKKGAILLVSVMDDKIVDGFAPCQIETEPVLQGALFAIQNGNVVASQGGFHNTGFDRSFKAVRQLGSSWKPILYALALKYHWNYLDMLENDFNVFQFTNQFYFPRPDHKNKGDVVSIAWSATRSENIASIWLLEHLLDKLSLEEFYDIAAVNDMARHEDEDTKKFFERLRDKYGLILKEDTKREIEFTKARDALAERYRLEGKDDKARDVLNLRYGTFNDVAVKQSKKDAKTLSFIKHNYKRYSEILRERQAQELDPTIELPPLDSVVLLNHFTLADMKRLSTMIEPVDSEVDYLDAEHLRYWPDYRRSLAFAEYARFAKEIGIHQKLQKVFSMPLGVNDITLAEISTAYQTLLTGKVFKCLDGDWTDPCFIKEIKNRDGKVIFRNKSESKVVLGDSITSQIAVMLHSVFTNGTARSQYTHITVTSPDKAITLRYPALGKTGTTNDYRNVAFLGALPTYVNEKNGIATDSVIAIGSYVGFDDNKPLKSGRTRIAGASGGLPQWADFAKKEINILGLPEKIDFLDISMLAAGEVPLVLPNERGQLTVDPMTGSIIAGGSAEQGRPLPWIEVPGFTPPQVHAAAAETAAAHGIMISLPMPTAAPAASTDSTNVAEATPSAPAEGATAEGATTPTVQPQPTQPAQPKAAAMPKDDDWDLPEGFDSKNAFVPIEAD
ncbi:transglycosylase domain-containing protein [Fibrobacter sp. UWB10]|uniref:transglycosylase domain-containing protein n=1 Tax=Fibrobacter sp. UWB10 TaxID=1896201 RepID=UPI002402FB9D|nr:transglycosylase domain-containing protein [Fibrobacter sp. UWB10]SMP41481.1 Transglycosylase [Fibrobacter sp. UWB10]